MFSQSSLIIKARFGSSRLLSSHYFIPVNSLNFHGTLPIFHPYLLLCSQLVISQFHSDTNQLSVSQFLSEMCVVRGTSSCTLMMLLICVSSLCSLNLLLKMDETGPKKKYASKISHHFFLIIFSPASFYPSSSSFWRTALQWRLLNTGTLLPTGLHSVRLGSAGIYFFTTTQLPEGVS